MFNFLFLLHRQIWETNDWMDFIVQIFFYSESMFQCLVSNGIIIQMDSIMDVYDFRGEGVFKTNWV